MKFAAILVVIALSAMPLTAARVQIVLDVSGSMRASAGDTSRMEAARRAVRATVEAIDSSSNVALRLYGHRLPAEPKEASCRDTELVIPFGPLDRARFIAAITRQHRGARRHSPTHSSRHPPISDRSVTGFARGGEP